MEMLSKELMRGEKQDKQVVPHGVIDSHTDSNCFTQLRCKTNGIRSYYQL